MTDIRSGSENVKKVFRLQMPVRTFDFLKTLTLTNAEMVEIVTLVDEKEKHTKRKTFPYDQLCCIVCQQTYGLCIFCKKS